MKVFIVFLGLFTIGVMGLVYQGDLGLYGHEQLLLKEAAEECAAGAALYIDENEYAKGKFVFDYSQGRKYAEDYLQYIKRNSKAFSTGSVKWNMEFEDEKQGYAVSNFNKIPTVTMKITVTTKDLFRLPFIEVTKLERSARYELPEEITK